MPNILEERIKTFNKGRYPPLLAMKYSALAENPFRFFRGTAHLFWEDMARLAEWKDKTRTWCCGDLHLENFGSYRAANGQVYFDINDFDEAALAPATWEVARFLVSLYAAGDTWGIKAKQASELGSVFLEGYTRALSEGKAYAIEKETTSPLIRSFIEQVEKRTDANLLTKRTFPEKNKIRKDDGKALTPPANRKQEILKTFSKYTTQSIPSLKAKDLAIRVAGTGSLGVDRYIILCRDGQTGKAMLFDLKQSHLSSLALYSPVRQPKWKNEADRIVTIQRLMPYATPRFLDTLIDKKEDFILRQLQPSADKFDHTLCKGKPALMAELLREMASALASAQIRSSSRFGSTGVDDLIELSGRASWKRSILTFASDYHVQLLKDHAAYRKLFTKGAFHV